MASIFSRLAFPLLLAAAAGLAGSLAGCAIPPDAMAPIADVNTTVYRLGAGDQIRVITVGEDALSGQFRVDADGSVDMPVLGPVKAAGRTAAELAADIAAALRTNNQYRDPRVSVEVAGYRTLAILGEVARPGQYPYQPDMTVVTAAAAAGGFTYRAVDDRFAVTRSVDGKIVQGRATLLTRLLPGDVVLVYERRF